MSIFVNFKHAQRPEDPIRGCNIFALQGCADRGHGDKAMVVEVAQMPEC
jgi:hypothetical protein